VLCKKTALTQCVTEAIVSDMQAVEVAAAANSFAFRFEKTIIGLMKGQGWQDAVPFAPVADAS